MNKTVIGSERIGLTADLRHGFVINGILSGAPGTSLKNWMGHATVQSQAVYLKAFGAEECEIIATMPNQAFEVGCFDYLSIAELKFCSSYVRMISHFSAEK